MGKAHFSLFTDAYEVLMESLSEANLLPQFDTAEVVEEHLYGSLNEEELLAFVNKLNEVYPYTITISRGHDRLEGPHTQIPYEERGFIFVFLVGYFNDNIDRQFNMVKVEGFVNDNTHPVIMYFRYSNKAWKLMKVELLTAERDSDNPQEASSPNTYLPQIKIDGTVYYQCHLDKNRDTHGSHRGSDERTEKPKGCHGEYMQSPLEQKKEQRKTRRNNRLLICEK